MLSIVSGKKTWDRHIVFRAAVWTLVLRGKKSWNRRGKCLCLRLVFLRESTEGQESVWIRRSWLKCRPVGKGNENDFAPEAEKGSRAFRVV